MDCRQPDLKWFTFSSWWTSGACDERQFDRKSPGIRRLQGNLGFGADAEAVATFLKPEDRQWARGTIRDVQRMLVGFRLVDPAQIQLARRDGQDRLTRCGRWGFVAEPTAHQQDDSTYQHTRNSGKHTPPERAEPGRWRRLRVELRCAVHP